MGKRAAQALAESLRGKGVRSHHQNGFRCLTSFDQGNNALDERFGFAGAGGAFYLDEAVGAGGNGIYHVNLPSVAAICGPSASGARAVFKKVARMN